MDDMSSPGEELRNTKMEASTGELSIPGSGNIDPEDCTRSFVLPCAPPHEGPVVVGFGQVF